MSMQGCMKASCKEERQLAPELKDKYEKNAVMPPKVTNEVYTSPEDCYKLKQNKIL